MNASQTVDVPPSSLTIPEVLAENVSGGEFDPRDYEGSGSTPIEVTFGVGSPYRRKSSLNPTMAARPQSVRRTTDCYVHSILNEHKGSEAPDLSFQGATEEKMSDKDPHGDKNQRNESRLLTKKQISDMAFGIRELAKRLSSIRVKTNVRNVFVLCKAHDEGLIKNTRDVTEWILQKQDGLTVWVEETLEHNDLFDAKSLRESCPTCKDRLRFWNEELCAKRPQTFDIIVALGGDGTVLYASHLFQRIVPAVISFSLGSLGFLTKFDYEGYPDTLTKAFHDGITVSLRLRFEATVMRSRTRDKPDQDLVEELIGEEADNQHTHVPDGTHNILNELVVDRGPNPTMSTIELFGDDQHFTTIQADGICISTPTGSTAYNLAAGGSLCHPDNPVILVTAICAHTLSFRPIILPDTIVMRAGVPYDARTSSWASFDGRERVELKPGDYVTVSASRFPFPSVLPLDRKSKDWVDSISRTLQWNSRQRQKSFKEWSDK